MGNPLNEEQLKELLIKKFIEEFGCQPQGQDLFTTDFDDMGIDSLDVAEFVMDIEDELQMEISMEPFANLEEISNWIYWKV